MGSQLTLYPQQIEVKYLEAAEYIRWVTSWLQRDLVNGRKLQPLEVLGYDKLMKVHNKFYRRLANRKANGKDTFKVTLTATELIAVNMILNEYPIALYNLLGQVERKVYNYDRIIDVI